tara:strand:+ start:5287 stop:6042 length:756 start_codon:yes stop_codon:yes gene_type:complete
MESVIWNDDCFSKFKDISNNTVQLVVVDLPYGQTHCKWDTCIDLEKMWAELKRVLTPNGQVVFFCTTKFGYSLINSNPKWFRYDIIYEKMNGIGFLNAKLMPLRKHEMIYIFHNPTKPKDLKWIYNPQKTEGKPYSRLGGLKKAAVYGIQDMKETTILNKTDRYPTSIIKHNYDLSKIHPTQKPVGLCEWLVNTYSNEGDVVLDFTMGSGSTVIACINTNRRYIGIEKDEAIFLTAQKRINERLTEMEDVK